MQASFCFYRVQATCEEPDVRVVEKGVRCLVARLHLTQGGRNPMEGNS
jgi:hypothetical protein